MLFIRTTFTALALGFMLSAAAAPSPSEPVLRVSVLKLTLSDMHSEVISETLEVLRRRLSNYRLIVSNDDLEAQHLAAQRGTADLFIGTAGFYWEIHQKGFTALGTLASPMAPNPNAGMAGAIIVRRSDAQIKTLEDLKGKSAAVTRKDAFMNAQTALGEISARGWDPDNFFSRIEEVGRPMERVVEAVATGRVDAGLVKAGLMELMLAVGSPFAKEIRVLEPRSGDSMKYLHTSSAYPGWTVIASAGLPPETLRNVTMALYAISPEEIWHSQWLPATDFARIDKLFKELRFGPYEYLRHWTAERIWKEYSLWILLFAAALLFGLLHTIRSDMLVRRRTAELAAASDRLNRLEKASVTAQLSNIVAHELLQPISAAGYYLAAIDKLLARNPNAFNTALGQQLSALCGKTRTTLQRCSTIIERVRLYARSRASTPAKIELSSFIRVLADRLKQMHSLKIPPLLKLQPGVVLADAVELEVLLTNLLKNASEAAASADVPYVELDMDTLPNGAVKLTITNSCQPLTPAEQEALSSPLHSSKENGLGLGLAVVRSIAERNETDLLLSEDVPGIFRVVLTFQQTDPRQEGAAL